MKHGAVGLVHAVAEDQLVVHDGWGADDRQLQVGCCFSPGNPLTGLVIPGKGIESGGVESAQPGDENLATPGNRRSNKMILALKDPKHMRTGGTGLDIDIPGPPRIAAISAPGLARLPGERRI